MDKAWYNGIVRFKKKVSKEILELIYFKTIWPIQNFTKSHPSPLITFSTKMRFVPYVGQT